MPLVEISMSKAKWDKLDADTQKILNASVIEFAKAQVAALAQKDMEAVKAAKEGGKVTVSDWPAEERAKFRKIAASQWEKIADRSPNAKKVYDTLTNYLRTNGLIK